MVTKTSLERLTAVAFALALLASTALAQSAPQYDELPNFHRVNDQLYRGAQPRDGGIRKLAELGIKTILNLRGEDAQSRAEEAEARAAGLRYFNVPLPEWGRPTNEQIERVLAIVNEPANGPVFVHCRRGADRTGAVIACYRIAHDGWTSENAKHEANLYGMSWTEFEMKEYITEYHKRHQEQTGAASLHHHEGFFNKAGDLSRRTVSAASAATRRGLKMVRSHSFTQKSLHQLKRVVP